MPITPEDLAAIPEEHRKVIARWLIQRSETFTSSWMLPSDAAAIIQSALTGSAVDIADPLSDDSTTDHATRVLDTLR